MTVHPMTAHPMTLARTVLPVLAAGCLAIGVAASPAVAQFGGDAGMANAFRQDFYRRDLVLFHETLGLEEWQRPIVEVLLDDYAASFEAGMAGFRDRISQVRVEAGDGDGRQIMARMMQPLDAWDREKAVLREAFLENVRMQLSPAQLDRWPSFERAVRRDKELPQSELSGEGVDLTQFVRRLQLGPAFVEAARPAVEQYELLLDQALAARERRMRDLQPELREAMQQMDFQRGLQLMNQIMAARIEVRAAQDRGLELIAAALPDAEADEFREMVFEQAYPKVYGPNPTLAFIESVKRISDLTEEQRLGIAAIEAEYLVQLETLNARLRELYRSEEPREPQRRFDRILARQRGDTPPRASAGDPPAIRETRTEREALGRQTREAIVALLTPEQSVAVPGFGSPAADNDFVGRRGEERVTRPGPVQMKRSREEIERRMNDPEAADEMPAEITPMRSGSAKRTSDTKKEADPSGKGPPSSSGSGRSNPKEQKPQ